MTSEAQLKNYEDTFLIQEISKKYILIPKLRSAFVNNYIQNMTPNPNNESLQILHPVQDKNPMTDVNPSTNENTDWKSKYEILNILKNEENKEQTVNLNIDVKGVSEPNVTKQSLLRNIEEQAVNYNNNINTDLETTNKYLNELPEKDVSHDALNHEFTHPIIEYSPNDTTYANTIPNTYNENSKEFIANVDPTDDLNFKLRDIKLDYNHSDATNIFPPVGVSNYEAKPESDVDMPSTGPAIPGKLSGDTYSEHIENENVYPVEVDSAIYDQNVAVEQNKSADSEQVLYLDGDEISPIQLVNPSGLVNEMQNALPVVGDFNNIAKDEDSVEFGNIQEFTKNQSIQMKTDVNVNIQEKVEEQTNVDSMYDLEIPAEGVELTENQVDVSGSIADFDAEQREMFYSEPTDESNTYPQGDVNAFNPEYSQMENQESQENAYYVGIQQEAYPVEISDQEMTQQYDPNYEQQYVHLDEGLEEQQYEQQPEQYERQSYDQQEPTFEVQQYEQQNYETQEQVEQVLDVEDGYIDQQQLAETVEEQYIGEDFGIEQSNAEEIQTSEQVMG